MITQPTITAIRFALAVFLMIAGCGTSASPGGGGAGTGWSDVATRFGNDDGAVSSNDGSSNDVTSLDASGDGSVADSVAVDDGAGTGDTAATTDSTAADADATQDTGPELPELLCAPCHTNGDCATTADPDAACVDRGAMGNFCGTSCQTIADCPEGYGCNDAILVDGTTAKRCVLLDDAAECVCPKAAIDAKLTTTCSVAGTTASAGATSCVGSRGCGEAGLTTCDAAAPSEETCDNVDNDCDGTTDGVGCDDGNACSEGDTCTAGTCQPGAPKACDDNDPCTLDECALQSGACTHTPTNGALCDDGDICTVGDVCTPDGCKGGEKPCDDGNVCTTDACSAPDGCVHVATEGPCVDADACTSGEVCQGGVCTSTATSCDDKSACTIDSCDTAAGCKHEALADGSSCDGDGTCEAGVCKPKCPPSGSQTFDVSGKIESFVVPECATSLTVEVRGAQGGNSTSTGLGGLGAMVQGKVPVTAGETLKILVGAQGGSAPYPCGGGGGSFLVRGSDPLLVAGGGGGAYSSWAQTGHSTALTPVGTQGTGGAEWKLGGGGGGFHQDGQPSGGAGGASFLNGGAGGKTYPVDSTNCGAGGFGGGGGGSQNGTFNAGGGGGYVGGKSGNGNATTGGSSYIGATVVEGKHTPQIQTGNGKVVVSW